MTLLGRGACHKWHLAIIQQHLLAHCVPGTVLGAEPFPPACRPGKGDQSHGARGPHSSEEMDQPVSGQRVSAQPLCLVPWLAMSQRALDGRDTTRSHEALSAFPA